MKECELLAQGAIRSVSHPIPQIQIRDDGELEEARTLLDELRVEYSVADKQDALLLPSHLLISSGARAIETLQEISEGGGEHRFLHVVVIDEASSSLRAVLHRQRCDLVTRRPLHPTVLRLLVQRALYQGAEKRIEERVAIGGEVELRAGRRTLSVTLAELSRRGCGMIVEDVLPLWTAVVIDFPVALRGMRPLALSARVVGVQREPVVEGGGYSTSVVFDDSSDAELRRIEDLMCEHAAGPTGCLEIEPGSPIPNRELEVAEVDPADRRVHARGAYPHLVLARESDEIHSLIGRDLSLGGMRVAPTPGLEVGARLKLVIYGREGVVPVMVSAEVVRDDGRAGVGLRFESLDAASRSRLQSIVDGLEQLEGSCGSVLGEVLDSE